MTKTYIVDGADLVEEAPAVRVGFAVQTIFEATDADAMAALMVHEISAGFPFAVLGRRTEWRPQPARYRS